MKKIIGFLLTYARIILMVVILVVSSLVAQDPLTNIKNMIANQAPFIMIYTFGMTLTLITGGLDLSIGSIAAFSTCAAAFLIIRGHIIEGVIVCLAIGAFFGLINGLLITKAKVNPFIATYGMDWVIRGGVYIMMGGAMIYHFSDSFKKIADGSLFGISNLIYISAAIFLILLFVFRKTVFGRNVYMTGANVNVSRLTGVNTDLIIIIVYIISGTLAATAGLLYVARLDTAEPFLGKSFALMALAAALIGGASLSGGKGGVGNAVIGVLTIVFLTNSLNLLRISTLWQDAVFGLVIILSAVFEQARQNYVSSPAQIS